MDDAVFLFKELFAPFPPPCPSPTAAARRERGLNFYEETILKLWFLSPRTSGVKIRISGIIPLSRVSGGGLGRGQ